MAPRTPQHGFTALEMLVAMAIISLVSIQVLGMLATSQRNASAQREVLEAQEDSRLVAEVILTDLRMAGFMVPRMTSMASVDGGAGNPDVLCVSDAAAIDPGQLAGATNRFGGASLDSDYSGGSTLELVAGDMDIDGDGTDDFAIGNGVIVSDGTRSHCAEITVLAGGDLTITPTPPGGFSVLAVNARAVPATIYRVTAQGLERNDQLFSGAIEDVQVEFGVDINGDGDITGGEFPIHSLDGSEPANVRTVRLSLVARTDRDDLGLDGGGRPALANRNAGAADQLRRRVLINTVAPRNLL